MFRLLCFSFVIAVSNCQKYNGDPQIAAILQEQRYLSGDGTFGAAYQQEDGIDFKEESDAAGNRKGSYSYVDPSGQRRTVHYTAGKDGFRATGDHIPVAPAAPLPVAPQPQYKPDPRYNPAPAPAVSGKYTNSDEDDGQYHPELYEQEYSQQAPAPQRNYNAIPQPQKYEQQYQPQNVYPGVQQAQYSGVGAAQYQHVPQAAPAPAARQIYAEPPTPSPHRFFPPGKFSLNRSPDGFTYTFSKA